MISYRDSPIELATSPFPQGVGVHWGISLNAAVLGQSPTCVVCHGHVMTCGSQTPFLISTSETVDALQSSITACLVANVRKPPSYWQIFIKFPSWRLCDGSHTHDPWDRFHGKWATATEVEYPMGLCRAWAALFVDVLVQCGANFFSSQAAVDL